MNIVAKDSHALTEVSKLYRNDIVPFYLYLILFIPDDNKETIRVNNLILSKWTRAGLIYIKEKAWKQYYQIINKLNKI